MRVRGPRARADNTVCVAGGRAVPASEVTAPAGAPGAMRASKPRTHSSVRRSHILALPSSLPEMSSGRLGIISRQLTESSCPSIACRVTPSDVHRPSGGTGGGLGRPSAGDPAHGCPLAPPAAAGSASSAASKSMVRVDFPSHGPQAFSWARVTEILCWLTLPPDARFSRALGAPGGGGVGGGGGGSGRARPHYPRFGVRRRIAGRRARHHRHV